MTLGPILIAMSLRIFSHLCYTSAKRHCRPSYCIHATLMRLAKHKDEGLDEELIALVVADMRQFRTIVIETFRISSLDAIETLCRLPRVVSSRLARIRPHLRLR